MNAWRGELRVIDCKKDIFKNAKWQRVKCNIPSFYGCQRLTELKETFGSQEISK